MRVPETQPVDALRLVNVPSHDLPILESVGDVREKLALRQELAQALMTQIREQSEAAERERHSRKTVALERPQPVKGTICIVRNPPIPCF